MNSYKYSNNSISKSFLSFPGRCVCNVRVLGSSVGLLPFLLHTSSPLSQCHSPELAKNVMLLESESTCRILTWNFYWGDLLDVIILINYKGRSLIHTFFFLAVVEFELRALWLLGKCSIT
jgi:hypothetical protein